MTARPGTDLWGPQHHLAWGCVGGGVSLEGFKTKKGEDQVSWSLRGGALGSVTCTGTDQAYGLGVRGALLGYYNKNTNTALLRDP